MKKSISLLVFTHLLAVFIGMFLFCIANKISENNIGAWYNGTIDLNKYEKAPEIRIIPYKYNNLSSIYLYPSDFIDEDGYLTQEAYNKIHYENFGIYSTMDKAQEAYIRLNEYFQKKQFQLIFLNFQNSCIWLIEPLSRKIAPKRDCPFLVQFFFDNG